MPERSGLLRPLKAYLDMLQQEMDGFRALAGEVTPKKRASA